MAVTLSITNTEVCNVAAADTTVSANTTRATQVIADSQEAFELGLNAVDLANAALVPVLKSGVLRLLAAEFIERTGREEGRSGTFQALGITIASIPDHVGNLRSEAFRMLSPYLRRAAPSRSPTTASSASLAAQGELFGEDETRRRRRSYAEEL